MQSEQIDQLAGALAAFQAEITNPARDREVDQGKFTFSYTTWDAVTAHVREILAKHGLSYTQGGVLAEGKLYFATKLLHTSGQWSTTLLDLPSFQTMQALGSALTYEKRYGLTAALGIASEDDDDGQGADEKTPRAKGIKILQLAMNKLMGEIKSSTSEEEINELVDDSDEYIKGSQYALPEFYNNYLTVKDRRLAVIKDAIARGIPAEEIPDTIDPHSHSNPRQPKWALDFRAGIKGAVDTKDLDEVIAHYKKNLDASPEVTQDHFKDLIAKKRAMLAQAPSDA